MTLLYVQLTSIDEITPFTLPLITLLLTEHSSELTMAEVSHDNTHVWPGVDVLILRKKQKIKVSANLSIVLKYFILCFLSLNINCNYQNSLTI